MIFVDDDGTGQAKWAFKRNIWVQGREDQMITDAFDRRTIARMEVALERACLLLPADSEKHSARRIIASKIIECANRGDVTLSRLTEAGYAASMQLTASALRQEESGRQLTPHSRRASKGSMYALGHSRRLNRTTETSGLPR